MIICTAKNFIEEDKIEQFLKYAKELVTETNKENGCLEYNVYQDKDDKSIFCFVEKWESLEDLEKHFKAPHFVKIVPKIGELKYKDDQINVYEEV